MYGQQGGIIMSVFKLKDAESRTLPWRAVVFRQGQKRLTKHFPTRAEAQEWEAELKKRERFKDLPHYQRDAELQELKNYTVADLVHYYIEKNPHLGNSNIIILRAFLREDICKLNLLELSKQDINWFVEKKKQDVWKPPNSKGEAKPLSPRTIRRQLNIIQRVFSWSQEFRKGFENLPNPFRGKKVEGASGGRRRRSLRPNELEWILAACEGCSRANRYYMPLAIWLAIDTGMRRQEILNLTWKDIDLPNRRITIRKSKTDKATGNTNAVIVLPLMARHLLLTEAGIRAAPTQDLRNYFYGDKDLHFNFAVPTDDKPIFPMTPKAFSKAWDGVLKRAGIEDLHFHDLRRDANIRFIKAELLEEERNLMLRHADKSMNAIYTGEQMLLDIQDKLDRYTMQHLDQPMRYQFPQISEVKAAEKDDDAENY
jgi:integrase